MERLPSPPSEFAFPAECRKSRLATRWPRPIILIAPLVGAHYENSHRLCVAKFVGSVPEKMVIPAQNQFVFVEFGSRSEIHLTDFAARACMASDCDQQTLSLACSFAPAM